jgi:hypothetical protein
MSLRLWRASIFTYGMFSPGECSDVGQGPVENHLLEWNNPSGVPIIIIEGITNPMDFSAVFEEDCGD